MLYVPARSPCAHGYGLLPNRDGLLSEVETAHITVDPVSTKCGRPGTVSTAELHKVYPPFTQALRQFRIAARVERCTALRATPAVQDPDGQEQR